MPPDQTPPSETIKFKFTVSLSDPEYQHLSAHVKRLVALDPAPDSPAGCALQLLAFVVDKYEQIRFNPGLGQPAPPPDGPHWTTDAFAALGYLRDKMTAADVATVQQFLNAAKPQTEPTGENMVG